MINYDISAVYENIPRIMGLDLVFKHNKWQGAYRLDRTPFPKQRDKLRVWKWKIGIFVGEQGEKPVSIENWLRLYGGCLTYSDVRSVLCGSKPPLFIRETKTEYIPESRRYVAPSEYDKYSLPIGVLNGLYRYWVSLFGEEKTRDACKRYNVATDDMGNVIYWYIDKEWRWCHDKVMRYKTDGHRDKERTAWRRYKTSGGYTARCLYGSHLLDTWQGKICVVESEKTAVMCSIIWPQMLFLATGGMSNIGLVQEDYILLPDKDAVDMWKPHGKIFPWWQTWAEVTDHADIGDMIEAYIKSGRAEDLQRLVNNEGVFI